MAASTPFTWKAVGIDKKPLQQQVRERYARMGLLQEPSLTAEELQALMQAQGVRPEDNLASCGIIAARDGE
jgi:hypothetical protein